MPEPTTPTQQKPAAKDEPEPERYHLDYLLDHSRAFFGESRHMLAGALTGSPRKTHSRDEAKKLLADYRKNKPQGG
jgi:hypothetical protein